MRSTKVLLVTAVLFACILSHASVFARSTRIYQVVLFDPFIQQAPPSSFDSPTTVIYTYADVVRPAASVPAPYVFVSEGLKFPGVNDVILQYNGTFLVDYYGSWLTIAPLDSYRDTPSGHEPYIGINDDGTISYGVREGNETIITVMSVQ